MNDMLVIVKVIMGTDNAEQDLRTSWPNEFSYEGIGKCSGLVDAKEFIWKNTCEMISSTAYEYGDNSWQRKDYHNGLLTEIMVTKDDYRRRILIGKKDDVDEEVAKLGNIFNLSDIEAAYVFRSQNSLLYED